MNLDLVKEKLAKLKGQASGNQKFIWKPKPGKNVIRFLPYVHDRDWPFIELSFHYDFGSTILSPEVFGKPDPVNEFAEKLRKTGDKEDYSLSRKLRAKERYYAPILVRGEESDGVKFWGFSKTIYENILGFMDDDYGDLTDPKTGRDVTVEFTPAQGEGYPETKIIPKVKSTVVTDDKDVLNMIKEMPDVKTLFNTDTYKGLQDKLEKFLNGNSADEDGEDEYVDDTPDSSTKQSDFESDVSDLFDDVDSTPTHKKESRSVPTPPKVTASSMDDIDSLFDDL